MIADFFSAFCLASALISIMWIYRCKNEIGSPFGIFGVLLLAFSFGHFLFFSGDPIVKTFISIIIFSSISMNVFYANYLKVHINIGVDRRKKQLEKYNSMDRRKYNTHSVINKVTHR